MIHTQRKSGLGEAYTRAFTIRGETNCEIHFHETFEPMRIFPGAFRRWTPLETFHNRSRGKFRRADEKSAFQAAPLIFRAGPALFFHQADATIHTHIMHVHTIHGHINTFFLYNMYAHVPVCAGSYGG